MIVSISGNKGGVKKTTSALNIAQFFKPDYIIDLDIVNHSFTTLNRLRDDKFNVITFSDPKRLANFIIDNKDKNILIDCGGFDSDLSSISIKAANLVLIPTTEGTTDLSGLISINETLKRIDAKAMVFPNGEHHFKYIFKRLKDVVERLECLSMMPDNCRVPASGKVVKALEKGKSINEVDPDSDAAIAYSNINSFITGMKEAIQ